MLVTPLYGNTLPDIPFEPKSLVVRHPRFRGMAKEKSMQYGVSGLERAHNWDLLTDGITDYFTHDAIVGLVEVDANNNPIELSPADARLLDDDSKITPDAKRQRRSASHHQAVPWLKKPEYISSDSVSQCQTGTVKMSTLSLKFRNSLIKEEVDAFISSKDIRTKAIDKTFDDVKKPLPVNLKGRGIRPVATYDLLPDEDNFKHYFTLVKFENTPVPPDDPQFNAKIRSAVMRGLMMPSGDATVGYFLPNADTMDKLSDESNIQRLISSETKLKFMMTKNYGYSVMKEDDEVKDLFFRFDDKGAYYNVIDKTVRMKRKDMDEQITMNVTFREENQSDRDKKELAMLRVQPLLTSEVVGEPASEPPEIEPTPEEYAVGDYSPEIDVCGDGSPFTKYREPTVNSDPDEARETVLESDPDSESSSESSSSSGTSDPSANKENESIVNESD